MTKEEALVKVSGYLTDYLSSDDADEIDEIIKALKQEPIDYKTQYETYLKKSEVVISRLRTNRDRLQDAFDKIRAEIVDLGQRAMNDNRASGIWACRDILDKYKVEMENEEDA